MRTLLGQSVPNITTNADFPKGTPKDDSPLGSKTGTPITEKAGIADCYNALLAVIAEAGLTPNEQPERQVGGSQFLDALKKVLSEKLTEVFYYVWTAEQSYVVSPPQIGTAHYSSGMVTLIFHSQGSFLTPNTAGDKLIGISFSDENGIPIGMGDIPLFMQLNDDLGGIASSAILAYDASATVIISCVGYSNDQFQFVLLEPINQEKLPYNVAPNSACGNHNSFSLSYRSQKQ